MDIKEIQKEKIKLQKDIAASIQAFTSKTTLGVESIYVGKIKALGKEHIYTIKLEVSL